MTVSSIMIRHAAKRMTVGRSGGALRRIAGWDKSHHPNLSPTPTMGTATATAEPLSIASRYFSSKEQEQQLSATSTTTVDRDDTTEASSANDIPLPQAAYAYDDDDHHYDHHHDNNSRSSSNDENENENENHNHEEHGCGACLGEFAVSSRDVTKQASHQPDRNSSMSSSSSSAKGERGRGGPPSLPRAPSLTGNPRGSPVISTTAIGPNVSSKAKRGGDGSGGGGGRHRCPKCGTSVTFRHGEFEENTFYCATCSGWFLITPNTIEGSNGGLGSQADATKVTAVETTNPPFVMQDVSSCLVLHRMRTPSLSLALGFCGCSAPVHADLIRHTMTSCYAS